MHALGIPTTRALAVVATGEQIDARACCRAPCSTRVAASHMRVGTFEFVAALGDRELLRRLADYAIAATIPTSATTRTYVAFYERVVEAQASLIAQWMLVGFIHGVMNTDNMTISGETIDYGPCAFMDAYDPATVYSSIDHGGRYAYGNQPLDRAVEPRPVGRDAAAAARRRHRRRGRRRHRCAEHRSPSASTPLAGGDARQARPGPSADDVSRRNCSTTCWRLLREHKVDYTSTFRALARIPARRRAARARSSADWLPAVDRRGRPDSPARPAAGARWTA